MPDIADILLVTATPFESWAVFQLCRELGLEPTPDYQENKAYNNLGTINENRIYHVQSEPSSFETGGSFQTVQKAIKALSPSFVILLGIAWGANPVKHALGTTLVSKKIKDCDQRRINPVGENGVRIDTPRGSRIPASESLLSLFQTTKLYFDPTDKLIKIGILLTHASLIDNKDYKKQLIDEEPEALGGEMEAMGVYLACHEAHVEWIVVKSICDWADGGKDTPTKDDDQKLAAINSARFVFETLKIIKKKK